MPTEAKWEKAARGIHGYIWPWGNEFDSEKANTIENIITFETTSSVHRFSNRSESPFGCVDMAGNVFEWCLDWFNENEYKERVGIVKDPHGPTKGTMRVIRGGAFSYGRWQARCAYRFRTFPNYPYNDVGFRVCVSPTA